MKKLFFLLSFLMLVSLSVQALPSGDSDDVLITNVCEDLSSDNVGISLDFESQDFNQNYSAKNVERLTLEVKKENSIELEKPQYSESRRQDILSNTYKPPLLKEKNKFTRLLF